MNIRKGGETLNNKYIYDKAQEQYKELQKLFVEVLDAQKHGEYNNVLDNLSDIMMILHSYISADMYIADCTAGASCDRCAFSFRCTKDKDG